MSCEYVVAALCWRVWIINVLQLWNNWYCFVKILLWTIHDFDEIKNLTDWEKIGTLSGPKLLIQSGFFTITFHVNNLKTPKCSRLIEN